MVPCGHSLAHCTGFLVIQAVLNSLEGMKLAPYWPQPLALAAKITLKWTKYGQKGPKMAQNGYKRLPQVLYGYTLAQCT